VNSVTRYGQRHGTQFYLNPPDDITVEQWLEFMKGRVGSRYEEYEAAFDEGLMGLHVAKYRHVVVMCSMEQAVREEDEFERTHGIMTNAAEDAETLTSTTKENSNV